MPDSVSLWWSFLGTASTINIGAWLASAAVLWRRRLAPGAVAWGTRRWQWLLCGGYVLGCAFRSAFPVHDVARLCLSDSWLSSVAIGRSVATVAELCFVAQWALLLHEGARAADHGVARRAAQALLPMVLLAELCSWYSVLSRSHLGHVLEESLWAASALLLVAGLLAVGRHSVLRLRLALAALALAGTVYIAFMVTVDVPMYWSRWVADEARGLHYLGLAQGLADAARPCRVWRDWAHWRVEAPWMSLYFSVAVWFSIALVHAPRLERRQLVHASPGRRPALVRPVWHT